MKKKILKPIDQPTYLKPTSSLYLSQTFWKILRNIIGKDSWTFFYILSQKIKIPFVVSGGISSIDDIKEIKSLNDSNIEGVIVGKSIYDGDIQIKELAKEL